MFASTYYHESTKSSFSRGSPQLLYHNFLIPKKNVDGNFLLEIFKTQNNSKPVKYLDTKKRQSQMANRLRHRSTLNYFSEQKTIKTRSESEEGKSIEEKSQIKNYISQKGQSKHVKTSEDTFLFKKSFDLKETFFGFDNPENFQRTLLTKKRFYLNKSSGVTNSLDKDEYEEKMKQQTENSADCRGQKFKLLENYLSEIKRNRDDLVRKKSINTKIKKRITTNKIPIKKTLYQFLPKLLVYKNFKSDDLDRNEIEKKEFNANFSNITSQSFSILCGDILISGRNEDEKREIASLTKIMTCITGLFLIEKLNLVWETAIIKVSREAALTCGTTANLKPTDEILLKDLFYGMMLPSGNDAAFTIGEYLGYLLHLQEVNEKNIEIKGRSKTPVLEIDMNSKKESFFSSKESMQNFIKEMNKVSAYLELTNTSFANCHGLSDSLNYSTSSDIANLSYHCIQNPKFQEIILTKEYESKIYNKNAKLSRLENWTNSNLLLHNEKNECIGGKTGYTLSAGPCLMTCFKNDEKILLVVLLNCQTKEGRFKEAEEIFEKLKQDKNKFKKSLEK